MTYSGPKRSRGVKLSPEIDKKVMRLARYRNCSWSAALRQIVEDYVLPTGAEDIWLGADYESEPEDRMPACSP